MMLLGLQWYEWLVCAVMVAALFVAVPVYVLLTLREWAQIIIDGLDDGEGDIIDGEWTMVDTPQRRLLP